MPVKPVPSAIGGLVVEVDVAAAGSVVVIGEGDAWRPEALGAPSKVGSCVGKKKGSRVLRYGSQSEEHRNMERFQLITQVFCGYCYAPNSIHISRTRHQPISG